jgi:hypothetical protein
VSLSQLADEEDAIAFALDDLSRKPGRYWAGKEADRLPIYKAKRVRMAPANAKSVQSRAIRSIFVGH